MTDEKQSEPAPRPYWRRSALWDFENAIRSRIAEGRSYPQILSALRRLGLKEKISVRRLAQFCVEGLGIHSLRPSRHARAGADKKSAPAQAPAPAATPAPSPAPKSISELLAEDEAAQAANLAKFFQPRNDNDHE